LAAEHQHGARGRSQAGAGGNGAALQRCRRRIERARPGAFRNTRQREIDCLGRRIEHDQQRWLPALGWRQDVRQEVPVGKPPVLVRHLGSVRRKPNDIVASVGIAAIEPLVPLQLWEPAAQLREAANERGHILIVAAQA